jgi:arylsulfatase A-like enzyme
LLAAAIADETPPPPLDAGLREKLQHAGLRLGALRDDYPLLRPSIHLAPPADRNAPRVPPGTSVIVVLVESLSGGLLEHGVPGLTPNLDAFAAESLSLDQLWAAEFPTLRGELAALGSFAFGADAGGTLLPGRSPTEARLLTLADVLRTHGYSTVHAQSDHGTFAGTTRLFLRSGWDRALSADDPGLLRSAAHPVEKTWGLYDEDLFRGVTRLLEDGSLRPPFLLTLATTDTHYPYAVLHRHPAAGGNDLLDALHSTDAGFGLFWERFRRSPRAADTLVLVTADHALAGRTLRRRGGAPRLSRFDRLAGWLHVPGTERWRGTRSDVLCSQLDLTPSLLDVLGLDAENPFLGLSAFSDRPAHPLLPGREQPPLDRLAPRDRARLAAVGWTDDDQARWLAYLTQLARADRIRPR